MVHITEWGSRHGCTLEVGLRRYRAQELIAESRVDLDTAMQVVRTDDGQWSCTIEAQRLDGQRSSFDVTLTFELTKGKATEYALALEFVFDRWSKDNYILMPGAAYNGNRFDVCAMPYPPLPTSRDLGNVDGSITITDVPRLSSGPGHSSIALLAGDLATPAIGFHSPESQTGFWLLTTQETVAGQTGFTLEENEGRDGAVITLSYPGMRTGTIYRNCNRSGAASPDRAADFTRGDRLVVRFQVHFLDCPTVQSLFDSFMGIRTSLSGNPAWQNTIPFSACWRIQERYCNERWNPAGAYYPAFSEGLMDYQIGWVGGTIVTYALLAEGGDLSRDRAIESTNRMLTSGRAGSGFLYSSGKDEQLASDGIWGPWPHSMFSIRKNGDALYFLTKQCLLLRDLGGYDAEIEAWAEPLSDLADAFVRLWHQHGQFGQFADIETSELRTSGSTAGAIVPAGLALAGAYLGRTDFVEVAEAAAASYYERDVRVGVTTGGPLEILQCPDSESAYALLESFVVLYETTGREEWLRRACEMARQCATWNVSYDYKWPQGSEFGRLAIRTAGSVIANVQNKHSAPGICTLSGDSLFKLFRYTGDDRYLELIRLTAHNLPQYMSREDRPIHSWDDVPVALPAGMMCERVNMSDWEGQSRIGGVFRGNTWSEVANMLTFAEIPGVYVQPDTGLVVAIDHVEAVRVSDEPFVFRLTNPTECDADVRVLAESSNAARHVRGPIARLGCSQIRLAPGAHVVLIADEQGVRPL